MDRTTLNNKMKILRGDMLAYAITLCRDPNDAEDAVQCACRNAVRSISQFDPQTDFKAWLFRILYNCCMDIHRKRERDERLNQRLRDNNGVLGPGAAREIGELLEIQETGQIARDCVHSHISSTKVALTVIIKWEEDCTWPDAAERAGLPNWITAAQQWHKKRERILSCVVQKAYS